MAAVVGSSVGPARAQAPIARSTFFRGNVVPSPSRSSSSVAPARTRLSVQSFKFLKGIVQKPRWLPDFGLEKRKALLDRFYSNYDAQSLNEVLADGLKVYEGDRLLPGGKSELVALISQHVKPAFPDYSWTHATAAEKDDDGYTIVKIQAVGYHNGKAFSLPGKDLPPIEPSGKRVRLPEQTAKVKVEDGKIQEIRYLPKQAWTAEALYEALGGKL